MPKKSAKMESRYRRALRLAFLAAATGFGAGMLITAIAGAIGGQFLLFIPAVFALVSGVAGYLLGAFVVEGAGDLIGRLYGGGHTGTKREYSRPQALAIQGQYRAAVAEYEAAADEYPDDPEPLVRAARVLYQDLKEPAEAVALLCRAREIQQLTPEADITIARELVDLYDGPLQSPEKALPELARIAERYRNTTAGEWAGRQLARLRTQVWEDVKQPDEPEASGTPDTDARPSSSSPPGPEETR